MQRRAVVVFLFSLLIAVAGCGNGSKKSKPVATTLTITPSALSLESGKFAQLTATVLDQDGNAMSGQTITWSSSNAGAVDVTPGSGAVCAGKWDSTTAPTVCTPGPNGSADITATNGTISGKITVNVFPHVARVEVAPMSALCVSQGQTLQFTASAFDSANQPITTTPASFIWSSTDTNVATIDANGVVTAKRPGAAAINASLTTTQGLPQVVVTCPPQSISVATTGVTPPQTSVSLSGTTGANITSSLSDIKGAEIKDVALTYSSSNPAVATVSGTGLTTTVTPVAPGTATIVASCSPTTCNPGINQTYYSNPYTVTVSGSTTPKVVVTGTTATSAVIIDNATAGAPIALPQINSKTVTPNSILVSPDGAIAYIGTDLGLLRLDLGASTFSTPIASASAANLLAIAPNGQTVLASDLAGTLYAFDIPSSSVRSFAASNVVAADFSIDSVKALLASPSQVSVFDNINKLVLPASASAATQVEFLPQSSVALISNGGNGNLIANCDYSSLGSPGTVGTLLSAGNTSDRWWGADGGNIYKVDVGGSFTSVPASTPPIPCKPQVTASSTAIPLGASVTPKQLIAAPDNSKAFLLANTATIYAATADSSSVTDISLVGGGNALSGGVTPDGASLFVGASTNDVHRIDVANNTDAQQISVGLKKADGTAAAPNLVAVRPK